MILSIDVKNKKITFCKNFERIFFPTFTIYNIGELLMLCNLLNLSIYGPFHFSVKQLSNY